MLGTLFGAKRRHDSARRKARELAVQGRFRDAVLLGKMVNREDRNAAFECDLRDWRHLAYHEEVPSQPEAGSWPPALENPFSSGVGRLPEIAASDLTPSILGGALQHHGALIVRKLMSDTRVRVYLDAVVKAFAAQERAGSTSHEDYVELIPAQAPTLGLKAGRESFAGVTMSLADTPHIMDLWTTDLERSGVLDAVSKYFGERPIMAAHKSSVYRMVPAAHAPAWHQDGVAFDKDVRAINLWAAITPCGVDAPGLEFVPKRLTSIVESGTNEFTWTVRDDVARSIAGEPLAAPLFEAGDGVLFDQYALHRGTSRPGMTSTRYSVQSWLFSPSYYRPFAAESDSEKFWI